MKSELEEYLKRALDFPIEVHLESSSRCNARCITCPRDNMLRKLGELDRSLFRKAVEETKDYKLDYIHLHLNGEPLFLSIDDLVWRIDYAKDLNQSVQICMFTNGILLDEERVDKILNSKLDILVISADGGNKEDYERVRVGLSWEVLIKNVTYLVNQKHKLKKRLYIQMAIIPQKANENSVKDYFTLFYGIGVDHCAGSGVQNIGGLIPSEEMKLKTQKNWEEDLRLPCWRVFLDLSIVSDGRAVVCCQDVIGALPVGDLHTQSLRDIWRGEKMVEVRDKFVYGKRNEIPFCNKCDYMTGAVPPDFWRVSGEEWIEVYEKVKNRG